MVKHRDRARRLEKQLQELAAEHQRLSKELEAIQRKCDHQWNAVGTGVVDTHWVRRRKCPHCRLVKDTRVEG